MGQNLRKYLFANGLNQTLTFMLAKGVAPACFIPLVRPTCALQPMRCTVGAGDRVVALVFAAQLSERFSRRYPVRTRVAAHLHMPLLVVGAAAAAIRAWVTLCIYLFS